MLQASPVRGHTVRADEYDIHQAVLHQMPAGIVRDHGMRHAVAAEFPRGERGALIARPCFIDIDVNGNACVMRGVDRGGGGTDIDSRQPARVAMGENVDRLAGFLAARRSFRSVADHGARSPC